MPKPGFRTLTEDQKKEVLATLDGIERRSQEFRQKRRFLAIRFDRTERAIDYLFDRMKKSPGPDTSRGSAQQDAEAPHSNSTAKRPA